MRLTKDDVAAIEMLTQKIKQLSAWVTELEGGVVKGKDAVVNANVMLMTIESGLIIQRMKRMICKLACSSLNTDRKR